MSPLPPHLIIIRELWKYGFYAICIALFAFMIAPVLLVIPLSFNVEPFFLFTKGMLQLDPDAYSLRWYHEVFNNAEWAHSVKNSLIIGLVSATLATVLGTVAALGLNRQDMPFRSQIMAILLLPMIVPIIISATAMYFFYSSVGMAQTLPGLILAHTALGAPFVVLTVTATLAGYNRNYTWAAMSLGANPLVSFFRVTLPLILPGILSGAIFAFITSFEEVVVVLFMGSYDQRTIPMQMFSGIRDEISPAILAVATMLIGLALMLILVMEMLRRRSERLRGAAGRA